jgi:putative selenium metabolism hydrolase
MVKMLRDLIALGGDTGDEGARANRIREEMQLLGYDRTQIDGMGNVLGYIGNGARLVAFDGHIDTTGPGDMDRWTLDPKQGAQRDGYVFGRGASDQLGGLVAAVYAGSIMRELDLLQGVTLLVTGTVQEEDCDGGCWQYIVRESGIRPEFVLLTEPTDGKVVRGQRGRMDIKVTTRGLSAHGSAPDRGKNAIYLMAPILQDLEALNASLRGDSFLGPGSLAVSEIFFSSPSRNSVADSCSISIDRRLTLGESREVALAQVRELPSVARSGAEVEVYTYDHPSYKGYPLKQESFFPTWLMEESEPCVSAAARAYEAVFGAKTEVGKWIFSTNGVGIAGTFGIPCVGFGPGREAEAHAPDEKVAIDELVTAAALYALLPREYLAGSQ